MDGATKVREWASFLKKLRAFFDERGFYEVATDHLVPAGAFESTIDTFKVVGSKGLPVGELHTSPEIEMKRLLAANRLPIYQICRCFRDDPATPIHRREFTMLEYYRVGADYRALIQDIKELLNELSGRALPFEEMSVRDAVLAHSGIDLDAARTAEALRAAIVSKKAIELSPTDDWGDMFFKLMIEKVEPGLPPERPTIVRDWPASLSPLSKPDASGRVAERFEVYWYGMEICNGCTELTDLAELQRRARAQAEERAAQHKPPHPEASRLIETLAKGLPPCAGNAIGLERLYLCLNR